MTDYTVPVGKDTACANATEKISTVAAQIISKKINGMTLKDAKAFLEKLASKKASINNKFHTSATLHILELVKSAENNAAAKGIDAETLKVMAAAHKGPKMFRERRKRAFGMRMKSTHIQIVLKPFQKKIKTEKAENKKVYDKPTAKIEKKSKQ